MDYFPANYFDAQKKFIALSKNIAGGEFGSFRVPSHTESALSVDHSYFPAQQTSELLWVILSGIHGPETYAGSAIQTMFLQEILPSMNRENTGVLLVHGMNPYGFKNHRRSTENHINLNRNCSATGELYKLRNPNSIFLGHKFIPQVPVESKTSFLKSKIRWLNGKPWIDDTDLDSFTKAVGSGQFEDRLGLEFGGFEPEPQVRDLTKLLEQIMPRYKDVLAFDLHTGLGDVGRLHMLTGTKPKSLNAELTEKYFVSSSDNDVYTFTHSDTEGFYDVHGATNDLFAELGSSSQRVCALTLEFGTQGHSLEKQIEGLNSWALEHQGMHFGYTSVELEREVRREYLERFIPDSADWRMKVITASRELFLRVLARR